MDPPQLLVFSLRRVMPSLLVHDSVLTVIIPLVPSKALFEKLSDKRCVAFSDGNQHIGITLFSLHIVMFSTLFLFQAIM